MRRLARRALYACLWGDALVSGIGHRGESRGTLPKAYSANCLCTALIMGAHAHTLHIAHNTGIVGYSSVGVFLPM